MKALIGLRLAIVLSMFGLCMLGCSDSTTTSTDETKVQIYTQLDATSVTPSSKKRDGNDIQAIGVMADSLHISRVRILVSNIKMHMTKEDNIFEGHDVKVGPFLVTIDPSGLYLNASSVIPAGVYDHVKFEIHKFSGNEVANYLNDPVYSDFVTGDRYTMIVDGTVFEKGNEHQFTYKSNVTINLPLKFNSDIEIKQNTTTGIILYLNPAIMFRTGFFVLDPRDPNNSNAIDLGIKLAFHSWKK